MPLNEDVACPVCRDRRTKEFARFTAHEAADWFCPRSRNADRHDRLASAIKALVGNEGDMGNRECEACGFRFSHPHVSGDSRFYSILHEQHGYPSDRWEYGVAAEFARTHYPNGGAAADIGAGSDAFLKRLGTGWKLCGTESSETLRRKLSGLGIDMRDELKNFDPALKFELVTLTQVIEHIADPREMLAEIRDRLADNGTLALSTPYANGQSVRQRLTGSVDVPPNHVSIHTEKSMKLMLADVGLDVRQSVIEPPSWSNLKYCLQLKTQAAAWRGAWLQKLAAGVSNQKLRHLSMKLAALPLLPGLLVRANAAKQSANFLTFAVRRK